MSGDSRDILELDREAAPAVAPSSGKHLVSDGTLTPQSSQPAHKNCSKLLAFQSGPFQIIDTECRGGTDAPISPPRRRYSCKHYDTCLDLAAALNWDNYTCRGCSGIIDQKLLWRARQEIRKDKFVRAICSDMPDIGVHKSEQDDPDDTAEAVG